MVDPKVDEDTHDAIRLMYLSYRAFTDRADRLLDKRGLARSHHRILYFVGRHRDGSVADLLDALSISKQALNVPLRQLVTMGLVESRRGTSDGRVKMLRLSARGTRLEARLTRAQSDLLNSVFETIGPDAEDGWREAMRLLAGSFVGHDREDE